MALNKKQTSMTAKVIIVFVAIAFTMVPIMAVVGSLGSGQSTQTTQGAGGTTQIAAKYKATIDANNQRLATDPKEYEILVSQANTYSDWAGEVQQAAQGSGEDRPIFFQAVDFYKKALAVKAGDPAVATDMAIAQFYSGNTADAIKTAEAVMSRNTTFAPAFFNAGIFYDTAGDSARAIAAFDASVRIDPQGQSAAKAKEIADELRKASLAPSAQTTGSTQPTSGN
jgi:tetratricopeptide (TPR) repeat protein